MTQTAWTPVDESQASAGWTPVQETTPAKEKPAAVLPNYGFNPGHMVAQGWEGLKQLGSGLAEMGKDILMPPGDTEMDRLKFLANKYVVDPAVKQEILAKDSKSGVEAFGHHLASYLPLVGPWAAGIGEQAGTGDIGGALSRGGTQVVAGGAAGTVAKGVGAVGGMAREAIGGAIHTPEGELTPGASVAAKVGGGAVGAGIGSTIGHEYLGAMGGYKLGPSLMDRLFPEPAENVAARNTFKNTQQIAEAQEAAIKEDASRTNAQRIATTRAMREEQAARDQVWQARDTMAQDLMTRQAAQDKLDASDVRAQNAAARSRREMQDDINSQRIQQGQDLMNRQRQQDALDKEASRAAKEAQDARDQHAQDLMNRQKQQDSLDAVHAKALKNLETARQSELAQAEQFKQQHAQALNARGGELPEGNTTPFVPSVETGSPQDLISRTKKLVTPGQAPSIEDLKRAGDMTQVPLPKLKLLSSWGDELAKNEIVRRLRNQ